MALWSRTWRTGSCNRRPTILGADDKAAVAAMLHATELLVRADVDFPAFELCFTVAEEVGLQGAKHLSVDRVRSPLGAVFDSSGPVGGITVKAPTQETVRATFRGKAAHAGLEPEVGRNAIVGAARAVVAMDLGRLDEETTANVGIIEGGSATNIVPDWCKVQGECRSLDPDKLARVLATMIEALETGAAEAGVDVDIDLVHEYAGYSLSSRSAIVRLSRAAVAAAGLEPVLVTSGGGSDANVLNVRGIPTVNFDCGMTAVHTADESLALADLVGLCRVVLAMVALAPGYARSRR
jgi:tripeptide aminopeptidase